LFKYGKKIFDKLNEAMNPQFADEEPINPFDMWEGANFKLKIRNVEGYRNYDKSEFSAKSPLLKDDDKLEKLWKSEYSLQEFLSPKNFKSYDELKTRFNRVLGLGNSTQSPSQKTAESSAPWKDSEDTAQKFKSAAARNIPSTTSDDEDDEGLEFFNKLVNK
jgi:hypothetical protein